MHTYQCVAVILALCFTATDADEKSLRTQQHIQEFLSTKFEHNLRPRSYEANFRQVDRLQYSKRFQKTDRSEGFTSRDDRDDSTSAVDIQAALVYLQNALLFPETGPVLPTVMTTGQDTSGSVSKFETCYADLTLMMAGISNKTLWAVQMFDAWGKPGSGIAQQTIVFPGQFDQCLETEVVGADFSPQYCFEGFGFTKIGSITFNPPFGFYAATCVPSSCTTEDVANVINLYLLSRPDIDGGAGNGQCQKQKQTLSDKAIAVIVVCGVFAALMATASLYDVLVARQYWRSLVTPRSRANTMWMEESSPDDRGATTKGLYEPLLNSQVDRNQYEPNVAERALLCFSVYTNGSKVLSTNTGPGSIDCIHGIRFLSMCWVILGHSFSAGLSLTENKSIYIKQAFPRWTFQAILNALVSVDTFFTLSGLLMTYLVLRELSKKPPGGAFFFNFYFHRFWRLTPPFMLVMMVYITLLHYTGDGPFWPQTSFEPHECKNNWWANLLYISNLHKFGGDPMCMGWSWYLANDMQFYIISPAIFLIMYYYGWWGVILPSTMILGSAIVSGVLSSHYNLQPNYDLNRPEQGDYFDIYYIKPYCRIGPYLVGMITGYILYKTECKVYMNRLVVCVGWAVAWAVGLAVVYGLYENNNGHPVSTDVAALYNALNRIAWGAAVCWVIFACATGYGGFINTFLSWKGLVPLSRLTYSTYLVHYMVVEYFFFTQRRYFFLDNTNVVFAFLGILVMSMMVAFVASMAFEAPFMGLEKLLVQGVKSAVKRVSSGDSQASAASGKDGYRKF